MTRLTRAEVVEKAKLGINSRAGSCRQHDEVWLWLFLETNFKRSRLPQALTKAGQEIGYSSSATRNAFGPAKAKTNHAGPDSPVRKDTGY